MGLIRDNDFVIEICTTCNGIGWVTACCRGPISILNVCERCGAEDPKLVQCKDCQGTGTIKHPL